MADTYGADVPPFGATVRDAGGGVVELVVDRDTMGYPRPGSHVLVVPNRDEAVVTLSTYLELWRAWELAMEALDVVAMAGPENASERAMARIVARAARSMLPDPNPAVLGAGVSCVSVEEYVRPQCLSVVELERFDTLELQLQTEAGWTTYCWSKVSPKWSRLADLGERFVNAHVAIDYEVVPETGKGMTRDDAVRQMVLAEALAKAEGRSPRPWSEWVTERAPTAVVPIVGPPGRPLVLGIDVCERDSNGYPRPAHIGPCSGAELSNDG